MSTTIVTKVHFGVERRGRKALRRGVAPERPAVPEGRVPRVARLMALAIRFDRLIDEGAIADQAELARVGHVTRARVTQILNLRHLAPDIQQAILLMKPVSAGRDPISERDLRPIASEIRWDRQREMWAALLAERGPIGHISKSI